MRKIEGWKERNADTHREWRLGMGNVAIDMHVT